MFTVQQLLFEKFVGKTLIRIGCNEYNKVIRKISICGDRDGFVFLELHLEDGSFVELYDTFQVELEG